MAIYILVKLLAVLSLMGIDARICYFEDYSEAWICADNGTEYAHTPMDNRQWETTGDVPEWAKYVK